MLTWEERRKFYNSTAWNNKRKEMLELYNYECIQCKKEGKVTTIDHAVLEVDHILELKHHPKLALENDNLRVLCKYHHNKRHGRFGFRKKKNKWNDEKW